jgi:hypothetical protein
VEWVFVRIDTRRPTELALVFGLPGDLLRWKRRTYHVPDDGTHKFAQSYDYALHGAGTGPSGQDNWRWCNKCQGLSFAGNGPPRKCPMGGNHDLTGSGDYELIQVDPSKPLRPQMQASWRWCNKCQSLYYAGNIAATVCLEGCSHDDTGSGDYALEWIPNPP